MAATNIEWATPWSGASKKRSRYDSDTSDTLRIQLGKRMKEDRVSRGLSSLADLSLSLGSKILPLYANPQSFLSPWRCISAPVTTNTPKSPSVLLFQKSLKNLLHAVWNSTEYRIRKLVPILSEINAMVGLNNIKEWVVDIVYYFITEGYKSVIYDLEMYTVHFTGQSRYVTSLITRLYTKLGIPTSYVIVDTSGQGIIDSVSLWSFDIPRYTTKQLYEIFVQILHREGWQMDPIERWPEMFNALTTTKDVSLVVRLCKLQKVMSEDIINRTLTLTDLSKALEVYRKTKRPVYYQ
jgi:hypothetical protein